MQHALDDVLTVLCPDRGEAQGEGVVCVSAGRADRGDGVEMLTAHGQPPMSTVGQPGGRILPTGEGIGAAQEAWAVMSFTRAAGLPPMSTVAEPKEMTPGPPGTQLAKEQGAVSAATLARVKDRMGLLPAAH